jgi:hypothetical protein
MASHKRICNPWDFALAALDLSPAPLLCAFLLLLLLLLLLLWSLLLVCPAGGDEGVVWLALLVAGPVVFSKLEVGALLLLLAVVVTLTG